MERVACAVDVGTSAIRASLVTADGRSLRQTRIERAPGEGAARFDPQLLWTDFCRVLTSLNDGLIGARIVALAVAGFVGHVFLDEHGEPVGQAGGWGDVRGLQLSDDDAGSWKPTRRELATAGRPAVTGGAVPALWWMRQHRPEDIARVRLVLSPKDYLVLRLTGVAATDVTTAAYTLGSDVAQRRWSSEVLSAAGVDPALFPQQLAATSVVGHVRADASDACGVPAGTPVAAGAPDGSAGILGVIGHDTSAICDIAGTTDVLARVVHRREHPFERAVTNPFVGGDVWSVGGPTGMTGGAAARWSALLGFEHVAAAEQRLAGSLRAMPPGADGLTAYPCMTGGRFPRWNPKERGVLLGQSDRHTAAHIVQAVQESAVFVVREALGAMTEDDEASVFVAGGVARSERLLQMRADAWGRTVEGVAEVDVTSRGAALVALVAAGELGAVTDWPRLITRTYHPDPHARARYDELYPLWRELTS